MKINSKFNYDGKYRNKYYSAVSEGNRDFNKHAAFKYIDKQNKICEFGCGDASKLYHFRKLAKELYGFDISKEAIDRANKLIPNGKFYVSDNAKIFKNDQFDVTLCFYTLEHVQNPTGFIDEMLRTTKKGGFAISLCPNFGSPLCPSPPVIYGKNFLQRIVVVLKRIYLYQKFYSKNIYRNVDPIINKEWQPDFDTTAEVSLESVAKHYKGKIIYANSFWSAKPYIYLPFYILSLFNLRPFVYWGFNCFFVIRK